MVASWADTAKTYTEGKALSSSKKTVRRATAILCVLLVILQDARAGVVSIATWNLEWFPGGKPNSSQSERLIHIGMEGPRERA